MIRINLLPPAARRRRRRQPGREGSVLALMSLGWAALITAGYLWIAATETEIAELNARTAGITAQTRLAFAALDQAALSERQSQHRAAREALGRRAARAGHGRGLGRGRVAVCRPTRREAVPDRPARARARPLDDVRLGPRPLGADRPDEPPGDQPPRRSRGPTGVR